VTSATCKTLNIGYIKNINTFCTFIGHLLSMLVKKKEKGGGGEGGEKTGGKRRREPVFLEIFMLLSPHKGEGRKMKGIMNIMIVIPAFIGIHIIFN